MYVCMHACMHACMYVCTYVYICKCVYIYVYIYIYTLIYLVPRSRGVRQKLGEARPEPTPTGRGTSFPPTGVHKGGFSN